MQDSVFNSPHRGVPHLGIEKMELVPSHPLPHTLAPSLASGRLQGRVNLGQHSPERRAAIAGVLQAVLEELWADRGCLLLGPLSRADSLPGPPLPPSHKQSPSPGQNLRPINNESLGLEFSSANAHSWG